MPEYTITVNGQEIGKLKKKIKLTNPELVGTINGKELRIVGDLMGFDFELQVGGATIGHIDTAQTVWQDCCRIKVLNEDYQDIMIALAIIGDNVVDSENN